ncbi:MAG: PQQ-dependent sugar dehydrogenase [Roseibacillus sp.]
MNKKYLFRFAAVFVLTLLAVALDRVLQVSPVMTSQSARRFSVGETVGIAATVSIAFVILRLLSIPLLRGRKSGLNRVCSEVLVVVASLLFTAIFLFYTALLPMDPNVFVVGVLLTPLVGLLELVQEKREERWKLSFKARDLSTVLFFVLLPAIFGGVLLVSAKRYKKDPNFMEAVNRFQGFFQFNDGAYVLERIFKSEFVQSIDFDQDKIGNYYVLERAGRVYRVETPESEPELLVDFRQLVGKRPVSEYGAYSILLSKNGTSFFVWTTSRRPEENFNVLWEFPLAASSTQDRLEKRRTVLRIESENSVHNSGALVYDDEGYLMIGIGEMGSDDAPQSPISTLFGTILRIDPDKIGGDFSRLPAKNLSSTIQRDYFVPHQQPILRSDLAEEVWAYGLRNPFRIHWDSERGGLWISDIGLWNWEELNFAKGGENFGWPIWEAEEPHKAEEGDKEVEVVFPHFAYPHSARDRAIAGGFVYQGKEKSLKGKLLVGDNCSGRIWTLTETNGELGLLATAENFNQTGMTAMKTNLEGELVVMIMGSWDKPSGNLFRLVPSKGKPSVVEEPAKKQGAAELYATHCALCHGSAGNGKGMVALESNIPMPDFTSREWKERNPEEMKAIIRQGGAALGKNAIMPAWNEVLSEQQIDEIVLYLYGLE